MKAGQHARPSRMARIEKKVWPEYFEKILAGEKRFELRLNDFEVGKGDILMLREWDPATRSYSGRTIEKKVAGVSKFTLKDLEKFWSATDIQKCGFQIISLD